MSLIAQWTKKWAKNNHQPFVFYTQTSSTNTLAKEHAINTINHAPHYNTQTSSNTNTLKKHLINTTNHTPHFANINYGQPNSFLFIAESQTKGRGRKKRKWLNSDMMVSWSYPLKKAPQPKTVDLMGKALCKALKNSWKNCPFTIKKPNDIYIKNKKVAGLLIEVVNKGPTHTLIIGTGLNVFSHPPSSPFTHLQEHIQETKITEKKWSEFLNKWREQIHAQIPLCVKSNPLQ